MSEIWYDVVLLEQADLSERLDLILKRSRRCDDGKNYAFSYHFVRGFVAPTLTMPDCFDRLTGRVVAFRRCEAKDARIAYENRVCD